MSRNYQNEETNKADMGNKNNMNKYFALILTFVIVGGLLVNPIFSDISIFLSHPGGRHWEREIIVYVRMILL